MPRRPLHDSHPGTPYYYPVKGTRVEIEFLKTFFALKEHSHTLATAEVPGFMGTADRVKLDAIDPNADRFGPLGVRLWGQETGPEVPSQGAIQFEEGSAINISTVQAGDAVRVTISANLPGAYSFDVDGGNFSPQTVESGETLRISGGTGITTSVGKSGTEVDLTVTFSGLTDALHGSRGGGTLHTVAVPAGAAGFMSGTDKAKLDAIAANADAYNHWKLHEEGQETGPEIQSGDRVRIIGGTNVSVAYANVTGGVNVTISSSGSSSFTFSVDGGNFDPQGMDSGDTLRISGGTGITTSVGKSGTEVDLTVTLGNHSAALITSGNLGYERLPTGSGAWSGRVNIRPSGSLGFPAADTPLALSVGNAFARFVIQSERTSGNIGSLSFYDHMGTQQGNIIGEVDGTTRLRVGTDSYLAMDPAGGIEIPKAVDITGQLTVQNIARFRRATTTGHRVLVRLDTGGTDRAEFGLHNNESIYFTAGGTGSSNEVLRLSPKQVIAIGSLVLSAGAGQSGYPISGSPQMYRTDGSGASFPHDDFGHLVIVPRTNAARDIVLATSHNGSTVTPRMLIRFDGRVVFGGTASGNITGGGIRATGRSQFDGRVDMNDPRKTSARHLKSAIEDLEGSLGRILALRPRQFVHEGLGPSMGFVADEIGAVDPRYGDDSSWGTDRVVADLVAVVQRLLKEVT
jgi:hypothetical protein